MFKITIEKITDYPEKSFRYEASDGKRYVSSYSVPEGLERKEVYVETGKILQSERTIYTQDIEEVDLKTIIKAINQL